MNNNEIMMENYKTILTHNGRIDGIVGICKIDEFDKNLQAIKNSMLKAKGILIKFGIHNEQSLFTINGYMGKVADLKSFDTEFIFFTEYINDIDENLLKYEILVTGIA